MPEETELAVVVGHATPTVIPIVTWEGIMRQAKQLALARGFVPTTFLMFKDADGSEKWLPEAIAQARIAAALMYGLELGLGPMESLSNIHIIEGKPSLSAQMIAVLIRRAGHTIAPPVYTGTKGGDDRSCAVTITRREGGALTAEFSLADAKKANLVKDRGGWMKYPDDMMYARALTKAARQHVPDALHGISYTPEELGSGDVIDAQYDNGGYGMPESIPPSGTVPADAPESASASVRAATYAQATGNGTQPVEGWRDEDATSPKPTGPCIHCRKTNPGWFKPEGRWICRECGYAYRRPAAARAAAPEATPPVGAAGPVVADALNGPPTGEIPAESADPASREAVAAATAAERPKGVAPGLVPEASETPPPATSPTLTDQLEASIAQVTGGAVDSTADVDILTVQILRRAIELKKRQLEAKGDPLPDAAEIGRQARAALDKVCTRLAQDSEGNWSVGDSAASELTFEDTDDDQAEAILDWLKRRLGEVTE